MSEHLSYNEHDYLNFSHQSLQNPRNPWPQAFFHFFHTACSFSSPPDTQVLSCHFHADNQATDLSPALIALQIMHLPTELLHLKVFQAPQTQCVQTYNLLPLPTLTPVGEALLTPDTKPIRVFIPHLPLPHCHLVNHQILLFSFIGLWNLSCVSFPIALILLQTILSFT